MDSAMSRNLGTFETYKLGVKVGMGAYGTALVVGLDFEEQEEDDSNWLSSVGNIVGVHAAWHQRWLLLMQSLAGNMAEDLV
eukprot:CAMPEP_0203639980 /NCGR_PEP_ID=MMETSP0088-20131115/5600_1 /ASSEMBLY_ACC=CAM_ASM_001087 /TAXON_ID=426623 /ORGANISM="Chaetoceros affinis, Strain CCMP159" /LENGTH=80 /DNA_ID=CAMNT_0050495037 /DNA_START=158 /DNA_END=400 /DNA_ORIENTATION=-